MILYLLEPSHSCMGNVLQDLKIQANPWGSPCDKELHV